jgi:exopolysaccharide biosynthesis polyprenyl glycosylphosphotransferase
MATAFDYDEYDATLAATQIGHGMSLQRRALVGRWLTAADLVGAAAAVFLVAVPETVRAGGGVARTIIAALAFLFACVVGARLVGLHQGEIRRIEHSTVDELPRLAAVVTAASWIFVLSAALLSLPPLRATGMLGLWAASFALMATSRAVARARYRSHPAFAQATVVVGAGDVGQLVARKLQHHPAYGLRLEGLVDNRPRERRPDLDSMEILGGIDELPALVEQRGIERIIVAFSSTPDPQVLLVVRSLMARGVQVDIVPRLFETLSPGAAVDTMEGLHLVALTPPTHSRHYLAAKRLLDIVGASLGLVLASPLMLYIAWRIRRDSPGPILFKQQRWGMHMCEFTTLKFRTMRVGTSDEKHREYIEASLTAPTPAEGGLFKLQRGAEVTKVGRWLRSTSLDELPQLFNVLRGDMSLVGPRPCIPYEVENFAPHHFERFSVPQGLTGLWQVTARAHATFAEALDIDVAYARECSFWLDLKLILLTPVQLFSSSETR